MAIISVGAGLDEPGTAEGGASVGAMWLTVVAGVARPASCFVWVAGSRWVQPMIKAENSTKRGTEDQTPRTLRAKWVKEQPPSG